MHLYLTTVVIFSSPVTPSDITYQNQQRDRLRRKGSTESYGSTCDSEVRTKIFYVVRSKYTSQLSTVVMLLDPTCRTPQLCSSLFYSLVAICHEIFVCVSMVI